MRPIIVRGAGAFGTALAVCWARSGREVWLWGRDATAMAAMADARENTRRLPGVILPDTLAPVADFSQLPKQAITVIATPAQTLRQVLGETTPGAAGPIVLAAKGIELESGALLTDIAAALQPGRPVAVLSGPGFAGEIASGLPTALTIASPGEATWDLQQALSTDTLRLYRSDDPTGVQLGGALKNVVAIACGIASGAGLGESARAALMTRGFAEIVRLGAALGAVPETFMGLSGLGDLSLTCGSTKSRNFARGVEIGSDAQSAGKTTVEGIATAEAVRKLAARHGIDMPVADTTCAILKGEVAVPEAMRRLLSRPLRAER